MNSGSIEDKVFGDNVYLNSGMNPNLFMATMKESGPCWICRGSKSAPCQDCNGSGKEGGDVNWVCD